MKEWKEEQLNRIYVNTRKYTYIKFYNNERYQETLNGLSPLKYIAQAA